MKNKLAFSVDNGIDGMMSVAVFNYGFHFAVSGIGKGVERVVLQKDQIRTLIEALQSHLDSK